MLNKLFSLLSNRNTQDMYVPDIPILALYLALAKMVYFISR